MRNVPILGVPAHTVASPDNIVFALAIPVADA